jgi:hypothetical protein
VRPGVADVGSDFRKPSDGLEPSTPSVNENKFFNGVPDTIEDNLPLLDEYLSPRPVARGLDLGKSPLRDSVGPCPGGVEA